MRSVFLIPCIALQLAAQTPITAPIRSVRLHPDAAWVTRTGSARVAGPGVHRLLLKDLPPGLSPDDVRVAARGPQGSRLGDLSVGSETRKVTETPEYKALKAEWEGARDQVDSLEAEGEALQREVAFLNGLQAAYDKEVSSRLTTALPGAAAVVELSKGLQGRMADVLTRDRRRRRDLEKAREAFQRLNTELNKRNSERTTSPSQATVEVVTDRAGEVEVDLTYRILNAGWMPTYEARLSADGRRLELVLQATVRQATAEDWKGVRVEITNARSGRNLAIAAYKGALSLDANAPAPPPPPAQAARMRKSSAAVEVLAASASQNQFLLDSQPVADADARPLEEASGLAATWVLEGTKDIPADGEDHRFRVLARDIEPALALVASPRLDPTVHRVARFPMPQGLPLFPGSQVVHYAGTQRVGQGALELPGPSQPFQLGFGPFRGVRVELKRTDAVREAVGTFTKETQWTLKERISVANDTAEAVQVEVLDRELKPSSDRVKVTVLPEATPAKEGPFPGVRAWTVPVPAKGQATVHLGCQIRIPAGMVLEGAGELHLPQ
ncbi:MAG TPA: mucoidy inhibitor MuiA family protein [Holophaga sp.]|nr:mucoidy inhibitor MuiA family protein [Holophaga sp.]